MNICDVTEENEHTDRLILIFSERPSFMTITRKPSNAPGELNQLHVTHIPRYKVLLHNDDRNSMDYVVLSLIQVFNFVQEECERIMMEAHRNGVALCVVEPLEKAELHRDKLISMSLIATIEPE